MWSGLSLSTTKFFCLKSQETLCRIQKNLQLQSSPNNGEYLSLYIPKHLYSRFAVCRSLNSLVEVYTQQAFQIQNISPELKINWLS